MGFGTLFFGYALLLNVTRFSYTDLVAALIMLIALIRLSAVNRWFFRTAICAGLFGAVGLFEMVLFILEMFGKQTDALASSWFLTVPRYALLAVLTVCLLLAIRSVAKEVDLPKLASRCESSLPLCTVYLLAVLLEIPILSEGVETRVIATVAAVVLLFEIFMLVHNLRTIYQAYMRICMPEDADMPIKPSRFRFVNELRAKSEERERENQAYRLSRMKEKVHKKKKK